MKPIEDGTILQGFISDICRILDINQRLQVSFGIRFIGKSKYSVENGLLAAYTSNPDLGDPEEYFYEYSWRFVKGVRDILCPKIQHNNFCLFKGSTLRAYFKGNEIYAVGDVESKKWFCQYDKNFTCDAEPIFEPGYITRHYEEFKGLWDINY